MPCLVLLTYEAVSIHQNIGRHSSQHSESLDFTRRASYPIDKHPLLLGFMIPSRSEHWHLRATRYVRMQVGASLQIAGPYTNPNAMLKNSTPARPGSLLGESSGT